MPGFLYFVESELESVSVEQARAWGFGHAFFQSPDARRSQLETDDGRVAGLLLSDQRHEGAAISPDLQTWRPMRQAPGVPRRWLGYATASPPTPDDLAISHGLTAYVVEDARQREWRLPKIGDVDDSKAHCCALPRVYDIDADGRLTTGAVVARYRDLWDASESLWSQLVENDSLPDHVAFPAAVRLLATLYRVSADELAALGVFSEEHSHSPAHFVALALGYYAFSAAQEAKETSPLSCSAATDGLATNAGDAG